MKARYTLLKPAKMLLPDKRVCLFLVLLCAECGGKVSSPGTSGTGGVSIGDSGTNTGGASLFDATTRDVAKVIGAGSGYGCAILRSGSIRCWGFNRNGVLGDGTKTDSLVPVSVANITDATRVAAGDVTCAMLEKGSIQCWGANDFGELGNGTNNESLVPTAVDGMTDAIAVTTGGPSCAVLEKGSIHCWGANYYGQLGDGTTTDSSIPTTVQNVSNAIGVSAGRMHACALLQDGTVQCWGFNRTDRIGERFAPKGGGGALGDGTAIDSPIPVQVVGIENAVAVAAGALHSCAALTEGTVQCWGTNVYGQLGNPNVAYSLVPLSVVGVTNAIGALRRNPGRVISAG